MLFAFDVKWSFCLNKATVMFTCDLCNETQVLSQQLDSLNLPGASRSQIMSRFIEVFKQMWVMNGDHLSRLYAGTGALGSGRSKVTLEWLMLCIPGILYIDTVNLWLCCQGMVAYQAFSHHSCRNVIDDIRKVAGQMLLCWAKSPLVHPSKTSIKGVYVCE